MPTAFLAEHKDTIVAVVSSALAGALVSIGNVTSRALVFNVAIFYFVDHILLVEMHLPVLSSHFAIGRV